MFVIDSMNLKILVTSKYKDDVCDPFNSSWEYSVFIENNRSSSVQIIAKDIHLILADGTIHYSNDDDLRNESFIIEPGTILEYRDSANLRTSSAIVKGYYTFLSKGEEFNVEIPTFSLDNPYKSTSLN